MRPTLRRSVCIFLIGAGLLAGPAAANDASGEATAEVVPEAVPEAVPEVAPEAASKASEPVPAPASDPLFDDDASDAYTTELDFPISDPLEGLNRRFFAFNDTVDQYVLDPVTKAYQFVVPSPLRMCVRHFFRNLKSPVYFVNNVLQLRFRDAAETAAGFALNSTAGFVGLFDPATEVGWNQHPADFGQTLGMVGVSSGPYLVIPLLGPTTVRDGTGDLVDRAFDPLTYIFGMGDLLFIGGSSGFITREEHAKALAALRESSVDYYSAMRSAYTQNRESSIVALRARFACTRKAEQTEAAK